MTDDKTRALIAEIDAVLARYDTERGAQPHITTTYRSIVDALRRAKSALSELTTPDGDVRELLAEIIEPFIDTAIGDYGSGSYDGTLPDAILAAFPVLLEPDLAKAVAYYKKSLRHSTNSNTTKQGATRPKARNHRAPWTQEEDELLMSEGMSLVEKAERLGRSYFAVESRHAALRRADETVRSGR